MARPVEFDREQVVGAALQTFWKFGYEGTSIRALSEATGLRSQSLYNAFSDKRGLFLAVLARYEAELQRELDTLKNPEADLRTIREFITGVLKMQSELQTGACLFVITAFGPQVEDPEINAAVEHGADLMRDQFKRVLSRLKKAGQLNPAITPTAGASLLYTLLNGLSALARTGGNASHITKALEHVLESLKA